jgi:hypothetical protein
MKQLMPLTALVADGYLLFMQHQTAGVVIFAWGGKFEILDEISPMRLLPGISSLVIGHLENLAGKNFLEGEDVVHVSKV